MQAPDPVVSVTFELEGFGSLKFANGVSQESFAYELNGHNCNASTAFGKLSMQFSPDGQLASCQLGPTRYQAHPVSW